MPSGVTGKSVNWLWLSTRLDLSVAELSAFLTEVKEIGHSKPTGIRLSVGKYVDESMTWNKQDSVQSTKPEGGGGTCVECVQVSTEKNINAQACIVLTDGYLFGSWGSWSLPTLWCILDNEGATSDVGKTVHINSGGYVMPWYKVTAFIEVHVEADDEYQARILLRYYGFSKHKTDEENVNVRILI